MKSKPENPFHSPAACAAAMANLLLGIRPLLKSLGFGNELGKRHAQRLGQFLGDVQARIAQRSLQHSNVGRMQIGFFCQLFLGKSFPLPVPPEHQGEGIRHFQTPHCASMGRKAALEHRQLY